MPLWNWIAACGLLLTSSIALAQAPNKVPPPGEAEVQSIREHLAKLHDALTPLRENPDWELQYPDVAVHAKAAEWILRHNEFFRPQSAQWTVDVLKAGLSRAELLRQGKADWDQAPGRMVLAYRSQVDESLQPYALTLPSTFGREPERRWPLHVVLHGRDGNLNEVSFIHAHSGKPAADVQDWIQLDVFGRTNNAYRWAGESDVFEALADVKRRYRIDERRVVLHGFSMGGAGSWHLGLHYPSLWCSVGPGAGFVDFHNYQKISAPLPPWQEPTLRIYDSIDYALNAFNVPICTYGGELDEQLVASTSMVEAAEKLGITIKLLIGPKVGHKFHPESLQAFQAFHQDRQRIGRPAWNDVREIKFVTHTLKYNTCDWLSIEEQREPYQPSRVEAKIDDATGRLIVKTENVAVIRVSRDVADYIELDGDQFPLRNAAEGLLPGVDFEGGPGSWQVLSYESSLGFPRNVDLHKRHNLQGPIDDAFTQPFVCVRPTGKPWNEPHAEWSAWTQTRFAAEFDKWLRGTVPMIDDVDVTPELFQSKNLILFGDPGSNAVLAKVLPRLPISWKADKLTVAGIDYDPAEHGVSLIYPNPLSPRRYVVVNSGHTFHTDAFEKSNAWLFPRLGDIAVQKFEKDPAGGFRERPLWAEIFDARWKLPERGE